MSAHRIVFLKRRNKLCRLCNKPRTSICSHHPGNLTSVLNPFWSDVYQKKCHLVCCSSVRISAAPPLVWKIQTQTHHQQTDEEILKVLQRDCSKLCYSENSAQSISLLGLSRLSASPLPPLPPLISSHLLYLRLIHPHTLLKTNERVYTNRPSSKHRKWIIWLHSRFHQNLSP